MDSENHPRNVYKIGIFKMCFFLLYHSTTFLRINGIAKDASSVQGFELVDLCLYKYKCGLNPFKKETVQDNSTSTLKRGFGNNMFWQSFDWLCARIKIMIYIYDIHHIFLLTLYFYNFHGYPIHSYPTTGHGFNHTSPGSTTQASKVWTKFQLPAGAN